MRSFWLFTLLVLAASPACATTIYVSQAAQTPFSGGTNCNGNNTSSVATFNAASLSNGEIVWLCGTITSALTPQNGGSLSQPVLMQFDTGASIQMGALPTTGAIVLTGLSNITVDGQGGNCGWLWNMNNTCSVGQIESTANGSGLANQIASIAILAGGTTNVVIKGLRLGPVYTHTLASDTTQSPPGPIAVDFVGATNITIQNNTIDDCGWCLTGTATTGTFQNNEIYNVDHCLGLGGTNSGITFAHNHCHDFANWDQTGAAFHHDGLHLFSTSTNTFNGANVYGNLFDGDQGANVTSPGMYFESASTGATIENIAAWNNVVITHSGRLSCCGLISFYTTASGATATNGTAYNNTLIGYYQAGTGACFDSVGWSNILWKNNVVNGCQSQVTIDANSTLTAVDYNDYDNLSADQGCGGGCNTFSWHGSIFASFTTWKSDCSCDSHGRNDTTAQMNLSSLGRPLAGSTIIGAGVNLTSVGNALLDYDITGTPRSAVSAWDLGAFVYPVTPPLLLYPKPIY